MAILAGQKTVTTGGLPAEALAASTAATSVLVQSKRSNTRPVFLGNSTDQHVELAPGASVAIEVANLNEVYVRVEVSGEGVNYLGRA